MLEQQFPGLWAGNSKFSAAIHDLQI